VAHADALNITQQRGRSGTCYCTKQYTTKVLEVAHATALNIIQKGTMSDMCYCTEQYTHKKGRGVARTVPSSNDGIRSLSPLAVPYKMACKSRIIRKKFLTLNFLGLLQF
jgi:hypothetical protein